MSIITVRDLAERLEAQFAGDGGIALSGASAPDAATGTQLALAMDPSYGEALARGSARAAVLWPGADWRALGLEAAIFVTRPRYAMAGITGAFEQPPKLTPGIHPSAIIDPSARIAPGASIGAFCVIGAGVNLGRNARLLSHVTLAERVRIGSDCLIYSGVRIGSDVRIGDRFTAHYNAVVGGDGFSFVTPEPSAVEEARQQFDTSGRARKQSYVRIASLASVEIGDDVELGALATVDKGTVADTRIGRGTKLDNHVQVGHNVRIGQDCLLCAHAAVAGSTVLGDRVVLGGQAGVGDHLVIGNDVIAAGATAILSNVPEGRVMMGYPAVRMTQNIASYKALRRLPRLLEKIDRLEKRVAELDAAPPEQGTRGGHV